MVYTSEAVVMAFPVINSIPLARLSSDGAHTGVKSSSGTSLSLGVIHSPVLGFGFILSLQNILQSQHGAYTSWKSSTCYSTFSQRYISALGKTILSMRKTSICIASGPLGNHNDAIHSSLNSFT